MTGKTMMVLLTGAMLSLSACTFRHEHRHDVGVEPIEMTLNINLRIDRELYDAFDFKTSDPVVPDAAREE